MELSTTKILAASVLLVYVLLYIFRQIRQHYDIKKLGGYAPKVPSKLPFGFDIAYRFFKAGKMMNEIDVWHYLLGHATHNKTVEFSVGGLRMVFTADPENIRAILATQFGDYGKGEPFHEDWKEFLGDSIFTTDGAQWSESRNLLRPLFIKTRVRDFEVFERNTKKLMSLIGGQGEAVDVCDLFYRFTLDTATDYLLGASVDSLDNGDNQFATYFNKVQKVQSTMSKVGRTFGHLIPKKSFYEGLAFINDYVNFFIERVSSLKSSEIDSKEEGYTFLHALSRFTSSKKLMRDQLVAVLLAGRDTTAGTLSFLFYELSAHPELVAKLRHEILEIIGPDKTPSFEEIRNCSFLQKTISETLRLYPAVPYNVRLALKDTTLPHGGGPDGRQPVGIKKDTPIGYSTIILHRNPENYPPISPDFPDISTFCPERWNNWTPKPWTYIPFNGGPRICIGQQFALTEIGYTVVRLLQKYERIDRYWKDGDLKLKSEIVLSPVIADGGVRIGFWEAGKGGKGEKGVGL